MKAILLATMMLANTAGQPVEVQRPPMVIIDSSECRDAMLGIVESVGLKNHVYSSAAEYMKARNGGNSVSVTCKPLRGK